MKKFITLLLCFFLSSSTAGTLYAIEKHWSPGKTPFLKTSERLSWHNPSNWQPYGIPTRDDKVVINKHIFLNGDAECKSLFISKYTLHLNNFSLRVFDKAELQNFALVDPQGNGRLEVLGDVILDGALWISAKKNFSDNYFLDATRLSVREYGSVVTPDEKEFSGIPGLAVPKDWSKTKISTSRLFAQQSWDGEADSCWSEDANWTSIAPVNGDNVVIGTVSVADAIVHCDVSINGAGLDGGDNVIAGVVNSDVLFSVDDGITIRFQTTNGINAFGTDANGNEVSANSIRFTQSGINKTGKVRFASSSSTFYFENATFDVGAQLFSDNFEFGTSGSTFSFSDNITVRYNREGNQIIANLIPTPNGDSYDSLVIAGSGIKTLDTNTTATNTTVSDGSTLALDDTLTSNVSVYGILEYSAISSAVVGTINAAGGSGSTVKYNGGNQSIAAGPYVNLELGGNGTKTFPLQDVTVIGNLTISNNVTAVTQQQYKVILGTTGTITETGTFSGYISATDADGDGNYGNIGLAIANSSGAVGSNITVTRATGSGFVLQYENFGGNINRRFTLTSNQLSGSKILNNNSGTITLTYKIAELNGQVQASLRAYRLTNNGTAYPGISESSDGKYGESMNGGTSKIFSLYRFFSSKEPNQGIIFDFANGSGSEAALPVELISFTGKNISGAIQLNWETASETDNAGFILYRKNNSSTFEEISSFKTDLRLVGAGNKTHSSKYIFVDEKYLEPGTLYEYRLEDMSFDGKRTVIGNTQIKFASDLQPSAIIYPNPAPDFASLEIFSSVNTTATLIIYNCLGKISHINENTELKSGKNIIPLDLQNNGSGLYVYRIIFANGSATVQNTFIKIP